YQRQRLAAPDGEGHVGEHVALRQRVTEVDAAQLDGLDGTRPGLAGIVIGGGQLEELVEVAHVEQVLVDAGDTREQVGELALQLAVALGAHAAVVARAASACCTSQHDRGRATRQAPREERGAETPAAAPPAQRHDLTTETDVVRLPLLHEEVAEAEEPYLPDG